MYVAGRSSGAAKSPTSIPSLYQLPGGGFMTRADDLLTAVARNSFEAAEHGDLRGIERLLEQLADRPGPDMCAWRLSLEAVLWAFQPDRPVPELTIARDLAGMAPQVAPTLSQACAVMERVAFCTFDSALLAGWIDVHTRLTPLAQTKTLGGVALSAALLWQRLLNGDLAGLEDAAKDLDHEASRLGAAACVVETAVLRALVALSTGGLDRALELGRRASRTAQSESLSHHQYLANIALARIRRYSGRPHLALHILGALARVAPRTWSGWIGWETLLAGGAFSAATTHPSPSAEAQGRLRAFLEAARGGDRAVFDRAAEELQRSARVWPVLADEAASLIAVVDPSRTGVPEAVTAWRTGSTAAIPSGLYGIGVRQSSEPQVDSSTAFVIGEPGKRGRRFLLPGLGLVSPARVLARDSVGSGARTETGIAALALAGETGDSRDGFFQSVYGFPFVGDRHRAVLDTLCHRMRTLLGTMGEIHRNEAEPGSRAETSKESKASAKAFPTISLTLREAIIVPDGRCALPTADRVLRALALLGPLSANAAAERLRMPLRTVQALLHQLVAEGACTTERDGRRVAYRIEDTTFTEVTSP